MNAVPPPAPVGPPPTPAEPNQNATVPLDVLAMKYRQLRDKKKELEDRHSEELAPYRDAMKGLEAVLLNHLNHSGQESARTLGGTIYKTTRRSVKVVDAEALRAWSEAQGRPDIFQARVNNEVLESIIEQGGSMPPGIEISSTITVNIKK
jgi:hypothetical protein